MTDFSHKPTLRGRRALLRPHTAADIEAMGPVLSDPEVLRLTGTAHSSAELAAASPRLDDATRHWYASRAAQHDRLDLAVIDAATGNCVGEVVLNEWEPENRCCNFRILLGPRGRNRGLGSEATRMVLEHAFTATDLYRIGLEVYAFNPRARHVYEAAGFSLEGVRRSALLFDGVFFDAVVMGILRTDARPGPPAAG